ncbi:MAG: NrdH-redoxin [Nitrospirota bacterium]|nr:MAG: NrdH-redoxin [Nitrospirota bacterium]
MALSGMTDDPKVQPERTKADIEVFVRKGCPHCESAKVLLEKLKKEKPELRVLYHDVGQDSQALTLLTNLATKHGVKHLGVPTFYLRGELIVGFTSDETTGKQLKDLLERPPLLPQSDDSNGTCPPQSTTSCGSPKVSRQVDTRTIHIPWFGSYSLHDIGLPLFTILLGLLDGFNPCAMWVLLFLLSLLATLRDRRKMFLIAGTFVVVSGLVYFIFMAAWLNLFLVIGYSRLTQIVLGSVAIIIGGINIKDFVAFRQGISLTIPESAKPGIYTKVRQVIQAEHLAGALLGIVILAVMVNFIELACTAGFPALYTEILTSRNFAWWQYYGYLAIYNMAYMADDALMVTIAVITLSHRKLQERQGRWLKGISGLVMVGLGLTLLAVPEWLL